jgi:hypothetical protein
MGLREGSECRLSHFQLGIILETRCPAKWGKKQLMHF